MRNHPHRLPRRCQLRYSYRCFFFALVVLYFALHRRLSDLVKDDDYDIDVHDHPSNPPLRFFMGIMSHDKYQMERDRRQVIRRTYLSLYRSGQPKRIPAETSYRNRICSLTQVLAGDVDLVHDNCQLIYTFVIGGGTPQTTNRTSLVTKDVSISHSSQMLVVPTTANTNDTDVIYLNILENGKTGKSPTWLQYATMLLEEQAPKLSSVSFIIKTDSDTLLYPNRFFRWIDDRLAKPESASVLPKLHAKKSKKATKYNPWTSDGKVHNNHNNNSLLVYGGSPFDKQMCGFPSHEHCANLTAPIYMGGAFYFVSVDLARWIVHQTKHPNPVLPFVPHEDVTTGNVVWAHPNRDEIVVWGNKDAYLEVWRHPVKDPIRYYNLWRKYLRHKRQRNQTLT
jgi:Galactosyltransferase